MKRYRFRLEPVLGVRRTQRDLAAAGVHAAQASAAAEARTLTERDLAYSAALRTGGAQSAAAFLGHQAHRKALAAAVLDSRRRVAAAGDAVQQAREALTAASAKVSALERLDVRQSAEHAAAALREDELVVDDLVVARFGRDGR